MYVGHPPVLADLEDGCAGGDERVRACVEWSAAERLDLGFEVLAITDTWDFARKRCVQGGTPSGIDEFSIRRVETPSR